MNLGIDFKSSTKYQFVRRLGSGGSADVFLYRRKVQGVPSQPVVLKLVRGGNFEALTEMVNEGKRLAEIRHPHILATHGYEKPEHGGVVLVLEYVPGQNLRVLSEKMSLRDRELITPIIARALFEALAAAHEREIIHGDVSSRNILISKRGHLKLADFGQSRLWGSPLSRVHAKVSLDYLSPERWDGEPSSMEADVFSAGLILFEILTGSNPVRDSDPALASEKLRLFLTKKPWVGQGAWERLFHGVFAKGELRLSAREALVLCPPEDPQGRNLLAELARREEGADQDIVQEKTIQTSAQSLQFKMKIMIQALMSWLLFINSTAIGQDHVSLANRKASQITLTSNPWGEVFVDGVSRGFTPLYHLPVNPGLHRIVWKDQEGGCLTRRLEVFGNGMFAYQIIKNKGRVLLAPLINLE